MLLKILLWCHSAALRIPSPALEVSRFQIGQELNLKVSAGRLSLELATDCFEDLVARITPENQHNLLLDGTTTGTEAW